MKFSIVKVTCLILSILCAMPDRAYAVEQNTCQTPYKRCRSNVTIDFTNLSYEQGLPSYCLITSQYFRQVRVCPGLPEDSITGLEEWLENVIITRYPGWSVKQLRAWLDMLCGDIPVPTSSCVPNRL
jgi:hypothetical protein